MLEGELNKEGNQNSCLETGIFLSVITFKIIERQEDPRVRSWVSSVGLKVGYL